MGNLSGVVAVLAVIFRPSLVVPHVQVPDIRHLDWEALYAHGVRFLVFDKDNCLTAPHSEVLQPSIASAWERCQQVFGRENILIVSNSSGSSDDPSGLGAESLSRALDVPVLCHKQKKPARGCAEEALEYFVALSHDPATTIAQAQHMPPGTGAIAAGPSRQAKKYLRERRKILRTQLPADENGAGSILLVGDRTMTDVVLAHRMNDQLSRRRRKLGLESPDVQESSSASTPTPQCISVLTTGVWTYEGRLNALMRKLETRVTSYLVSKGIRPGAPGLLSFHSPKPATSVDWQKIAAAPISCAEATLARLAEADAVRFAYTGERIPDAASVDPTVGSILIAAAVRPLPPRIASLVLGLLASKPLVWISNNLRAGWDVMMKGLEFGVREAGIRPYHHSSKRFIDKPSSSASLSTSAGYEIGNEDVAPKSRAEAKREAVSASLAEYLESRIPTLPSGAASGTAQQLRNRFTSPSSPRFSASNLFARFSSPSSNVAQRGLHTTALRWQQPQSSPGASGGRPKVPRRNWIAAITALVVVPASYWLGMRLHDLKELNKIDPTQPLPQTPATPSPALHQHTPAPETLEADAKTRKALVKAQAERKRELELSLFHLVREREEVLDKLERVHQRRVESVS